MNNTEMFQAILLLISGVGIFMIATHQVSSNLEAISSSKLKTLLAKLSNNTIIGILTGATTTAIIQSSGATTVMAIGFVDAGVMTLKQAANIIYGSEIGTTITGQIVSLGMFNGLSGLSMNVLFGSLTGIGVILEMLFKDDKKKTLMRVVSGLGLLFVGLNLMSTSMESFAQLPELKTLLASVNSILLLVLLGAIITAAVQSSSAITSVAITMVVSGLINIDQGIYITLGANIGTCLTGFLAGFTGGANAKRTSLIQLVFNIGGVVLFLIINYALILISGNTFSFGQVFEMMFPGIPQTQLAMFHTFFNVASVIIVIPIAPLLIKVVTKMIPDDKVTIDENQPHCYFVNEYMLKTPTIALKQTKNEIIAMGKIALNNFNTAFDGCTSLKIKDMDKFNRNELQLDYYNHNLSSFISILSSSNLNDRDRSFLGSCYHVIIDWERIGDYSVNLTEYMQTLIEIDHKFSSPALKEMADLKDKINNLANCVNKAFEEENISYLKKAEDIEESIDVLTKEMSDNHFIREESKACDPRSGSIYLSLINDCERIADHLLNIANTLQDYNSYKI